MWLCLPGAGQGDHMYKLRLIPTGRQYFKDLPRKAAGIFRKELQTVSKSNIQAVVTRELGVEPGPVVHPFQFHI